MSHIERAIQLAEELKEALDKIFEEQEAGCQRPSRIQLDQLERLALDIATHEALADAV